MKQQTNTATPGHTAGLRLLVSSIPVPGSTFGGGMHLDVVPPPMSTPRHLDATKIRRQLPTPQSPRTSHLIQLITDLSGSMWGGNDAAGLRHEAALIALEHLASKQRRDAPWVAEVLSFDLSSPLDTPPTPLDRLGLPDVRARLLTRPVGGSSNLGPSLRVAQRATGRRLVVVMSDFELFDSDVPGVLDQLIHSTANEVLALVFRSAPPPQLLASRVTVVPINPATTPPAEIAAHIVQAANAGVASQPTHHQP